MANVLGYATGPVACEAAFIADFDVSNGIPIATLIKNIDRDRETMDRRGGMRSKYVPLRFDPATGAHQIGGRYLFDTWSDVQEYIRFTTEELEFEPGVKFWERAFFSNIDKAAWHVIGAHDFSPLVDHLVSRLERFSYDETTSKSVLSAAWPAIREAAQGEGLASVWLLDQPEERRVGLLTAAAAVTDRDPAATASRSLHALERRRSLSERVPALAKLGRLADRTSLNLSLWLPRSRRLGGDPSFSPAASVHAAPV